MPSLPARIRLAQGCCTSYDGRVAFGSVEEVERALAADSYLADRGLATAVYLALAMRRPLLLEGEAGVGKTEVGKTLARLLGAELIRLQYYEASTRRRRSTSGITRGSSSTPARYRPARCASTWPSCTGRSS